MKANKHDIIIFHSKNVEITISMLNVISIDFRSLLVITLWATISKKNVCKCGIWLRMSLFRWVLSMNVARLQTLRNNISFSSCIIRRSNGMIWLSYVVAEAHERHLRLSKSFRKKTWSESEYIRSCNFHFLLNC